MSNTFVPPDVWTEISTDSSGTFSLTTSGQHCVYEGVPPDSLVGHRYMGKPVDYTTGTTESVYVKVSRECFAIGDVEGIDPPIVQPPPGDDTPGVWNTTGVWN